MCDLGSFLIDLFISIFRLPGSSNSAKKRTKLNEGVVVVDLFDSEEEISMDFDGTDEPSGTVMRVATDQVQENPINIPGKTERAVLKVTKPPALEERNRIAVVDP